MTVGSGKVVPANSGSVYVGGSGCWQWEYLHGMAMPVGGLGIYVEEYWLHAEGKSAC